MPHARQWQTHLARLQGFEFAEKVIKLSREGYQQLLQAPPPIPVNTRSQLKDLESNLYLGLALYRSLLAAGLERTQALLLINQLFRQVLFTGMGVGIRWLQRVPDPFPLIRPVLKLMTRQPYLPDSQKVIEDNSQCFALDTFRCFKLDCLSALGAAELTQVYCNTDDWLSEMIPQIGWHRTQTLARGGEKCDFRWTRMKNVVT